MKFGLGRSCGNQVVVKLSGRNEKTVLNWHGTGFSQRKTHCHLLLICINLINFICRCHKSFGDVFLDLN